ncbi:heterokaryon incompatibility protein-domain-containing protein [Xylaria sp. FL0043]|nr:heterokaryon incompatibility protein-domain-containing protein [Xylaria sp. FL0043]
MASLSAISNLGVGQCANCKDARFDDAKLGGREAMLASGQMGLHLTLDRSGKSVLDYGWTLDDTLPRLPNLSATAQAGCEFCQFLIDLLRSRDVTCLFKDVLEDPDPSSEISLRLYCSYTWGTSDLVLIDKHTYGSGSPGLRSFQLRAILRNAKSRLDALRSGPYCIINCLAELPPNADPGDECSAWLGLRTTPVPLSLSNTEALDRLRVTLSDCCNRIGRHEDCEDPRDSYLPTRLIEIGDDTQVLRLVHSSEIKKQLPLNESLPQYAALSYCWGEMQDASYHLTSRTEAAKMAGFRLRDLPQVLQDAIATSRALSLSYIWIDALCILQDMSSDWEHESSHMGDIYGSAYITICSLTSSSQDSFLEPERPKAYIPFQSSINPNIRGMYKLSYLDADMDNAGRDSYMNNFPKSRWFSRGWTYQELRFSRRLLLLCPSGSAFMCAGLFSIVDGPELNSQMIATHSLGQSSKDTRRIYDVWLNFSEQYSGRLLTYRQDALPAISGAAKVFAAKLSDDYLAGIWRSDLRGLMWNYPSIPMTPPRSLSQLLNDLSSPSNYVAPSWSWIGHRYITFKVRPAALPPCILPRCQVEISTIVDKQNIFGRVKGGQLKVTALTYDIGPSIQISLGHLNNVLSNVQITQDSQDIYLHLDWVVIPYDSEPETLEGHFKLVLIGTYKIIEKELTTITAGIVVHRANEEGSFYRVGRFDLSSPHEGIHRLFAAAKTETITII